MATTLYTAPTANGQRASIALEECGIDYVVREVDLQQGEHRSEEMLALNPFGRIPVLQLDNGSTIYGSQAIGLYAANRSGRLLPDKSDRNAFHHWLGVITTDLAPAFAAHFYLDILAPQPDEWSVSFYLDVIARFLTVIDGHLSDEEYFLPGGYSLVDVMMYPAAATSVTRVPDGLAPYPNIARWAGVVAERAAVRTGFAKSS